MVLERVRSYERDMVERLKEFISINSVNPAGGGPGEKEAVDWLEGLMGDLGFENVKRYDPVDDRGIVRSNLIVKIPGKTEKTLWIVTHVDTVPEGDRTLWNHDPFDPVVEGDKIYGRGSEDNGGSMVASIYAVKAVLDSGVEPSYTVGLAFVADEEAGSKWGIEYLIDEGVFGDGDLFLVPDAGNSEGSFVEIAEKSILWLEFEVLGVQSHASVPNEGKNALRKGASLITELDRLLHEKFRAENELFDPPTSTFEPTRSEKTVDNVNTIPGRFVFCMDCRVLPEYGLDEVLETVNEALRKTSGEFHIISRVINRLDAPEPTPPDSELAVSLKKTIEDLRNVEVKIGGIGGGTCAAHFRMRGWHAVVWSTIDGTAHQPNEYKRISHMVEDAEVMATLIA